MGAEVRSCLVRAAGIISVLLVGGLMFTGVARAQPVPDFTVSPSTTAHVGDELTFDASSSQTQPNATYSWDFGDGQQDSAPNLYSIQHGYENPGTYTVVLTISDGTGSATTAEAVSISWYPPTASFSVTGPPGSSAYPPGQALTFADTSTLGSAPLSTFAWNFGDGTTTNGDSVTHSFAQPGLYTVTETVTDTNGVSAQSTQQVAIDFPPAPAFTWTPRPVVGEPITFDASATQPGGPIALTDFAWDFGDGSEPPQYDGIPLPTSYPWDQGARRTIRHTFQSSGTYTVSLDVTDSGLLSGQIANDIAVADFMNPRDVRRDFAAALARSARFGSAWRAARLPRSNPSPFCPRDEIQNVGTYGGSAQCWAEFAAHGHWYFVEGSVSPTQNSNGATAGATNTGTLEWSRTWTRHWSRNSPRCTRGIPGTLASDDGSCYRQLLSQFFEWAGRFTYKYKRHVYILGASSGDFPQWNTLSCSWTRGTYQCTNSFGDGFRWRPYG